MVLCVDKKNESLTTVISSRITYTTSGNMSASHELFIYQQFTAYFGILWNTSLGNK